MILKGKELLTVLCIASTMMVLLNIAIVSAIPPPYEDQNTSEDCGYGWSISAHVWGYAEWSVRIEWWVFVDEYFDGTRWALWPWVKYIGNITLEYWIDNDDTEIWSSGPDLGTYHLYEKADHIKCQSTSEFQSLWPPFNTWETYSGWAELWA
jgi:hypothetical protein